MTDSRGPRVPSPADTAEIAASLARIGWPVFPVSIYEDATGKRHKVPAVKWKEEATTDVATVKEWWNGEHAGRWIGVYCAKAGEHGIVVGDVDPGGDDSIAAAGLELPDTFEYPTHRAGGRHHVYAAPEGVELTIAKGSEIGVPHVDVRAGSGLMVYYGPKLKKAPTLAPAPEWLLIRKEKARSGSGVDRGVGADEATFLERLRDDKPKKALATLIRDYEFPPGEAHENMLDVVRALISEGVKGTAGVKALLAETRERYVAGGGDRARDWENAVAGSIRRFGLPPRTFPLSKEQRKAIKERNRPEAVEAAKAEQKATFLVEKHEAAMSKVADRDAIERPDPGDRVLEDAALAPELADVLRGEWAYSTGFGIMRWQTVGDVGGYWKPAEMHALVERVRQELVSMEIAEHTVAVMRGNDRKAVDKARTLLSRGRAANVASLIIGILGEDSPEFDMHLDLLNTPAGVVDLRTGELTPARPDLYLTKITGAGYDPDADMTMWATACGALPADVVDHLQVRLGQAVTGYTPDDDMLTIFEGTGENGKTAWLVGVRKAMGDYARKLPDRLMVADPNDHPTTLMTLQGARIGIIEELPEGHSLNVKRLKDTVGTPEITARRMKQDDVTFHNTTCIFLATNYLPIVAETDHGTWRRLMLVRFRLTYLKPAKYAERKKAGTLTKRHRLGDPAVKRHFEHTADAGLLRWLIEGARRWYDNGMTMTEAPARVEKDTAAWRLEADPILAYVAERLVFESGHAIIAQDLVTDFNAWLERRGRKPWSQQTVNSRFQGHISMGGIERKGIRWSVYLKPSRPRTVLANSLIPKTTTGWRGVRFDDDPVRLVSEAEQDAEVIGAMERGLG